jgi:hypothetical protein
MPLAGYPPVGQDRPVLSGGELLRVFGSAPPIMADYASALTALCPSDSAERTLLVEALPLALARVGLSLSLAEGATDRAYSGYDEPKEAPSGTFPDLAFG